MWCCLRVPTFSHFSRTPTCDGQTDRQTDRQTHDHCIYRESRARAVKSRQVVGIAIVGTATVGTAACTLCRWQHLPTKKKEIYCNTDTTSTSSPNNLHNCYYKQLMLHWHCKTSNFQSDWHIWLYVVSKIFYKFCWNIFKIAIRIINHYLIPYIKP